MARDEILIAGLGLAAGALYLLSGPSSAEAAPTIEETPIDTPPSSELMPESSRSIFDLLGGGEAQASPDLTQGGVSSGGVRFTGLLGRLSPDEVPVIVEVANQAGIDPIALGALRLAENGGPQSVNPNYPRSGNPYRGGQFGIQTLYAPDFRTQAAIAARSIANTVGRYQANTGRSATTGGHYTADFLRYFSQGGPGYGGYAPTGADPLNAHHYTNLLAYYQGSDVVIA